MSEIAYITRANYGAGPVTVGHAVPLAQIIGLVVHHTVIVLPDYDHDGMIAGDVDDCIRYMQVLQHARPDLGDDCPYSYVVFEDDDPNNCIVAEGRGQGRTGAHTIGYNSTRYGVAFAGDFTLRPPTPGMWAGVAWVGRTQLVDPVHAIPTLEHRDVYNTACPGAATESPALAQPPFTESDNDMALDPNDPIVKDIRDQIAYVKGKVDNLPTTNDVKTMIGDPHHTPIGVTPVADQTKEILDALAAGGGSGAPTHFVITGEAIAGP